MDGAQFNILTEFSLHADKKKYCLDKLILPSFSWNTRIVFKICVVSYIALSTGKPTSLRTNLKNLVFS